MYSNALKEKLIKIIIYGNSLNELENDLSSLPDYFNIIPDLYDTILKYNRLDVIKLFKDNGFNITSENDTLLMKSVVENNFSFVKYLVENGYTDNDKLSVSFFQAIRGQNFRIADYLLKYDQKIINTNKNIFQAAKNLTSIKYLVKNGADIKSSNSNKALKQYISLGQEKEAIYLMKNGADFYNDNEVLFDAAHYGLLNIIKFLTKKINYSKKILNEAFLSSCYKTNNLEVIQFLIGKGIDIHFENDIAIHRAISYSNLKAIEYLVTKQNFDINKIIKYSEIGTIFEWAVKYKEQKIIDFKESLEDKLIENNLVKKRVKI